MLNVKMYTINRSLFNKAIITADSRRRHFIKALYFTLQVWHILHKINADWDQNGFLLRRVNMYYVLIFICIYIYIHTKRQ